jgi:DNA-binding beta-propeller fold protein YncE
MTKRWLLFLVPVLLSAAPLPESDRSPVDLLLTADGRHLITANQTSGTLSLVRLADGKVLNEAPCGEHPNSLALTPDGRTLLASANYSGEVTAYSLEHDSLSKRQSIKLGFEPRGIAVMPDGRRAFVALASGSCVVELALPELKELRRIEVGRWPRELALSPDGSRLAVGVSGDGGVAVIDTATGKKSFLEDFMGLNLGQMQTSRDGQFVYFPWSVYRQMPIIASNIRIGWVLGSRIARVRLDEQSRREAITLDPQGEAIADPIGLALSADESHMYSTAAGSHELLIYRMSDLPFQDYGNPDHIHPDLLKDRDRFDRVPLGGRPMKLRVGPDGLVYVANYLLNAVQVVDPVAKKVVRTITLGGADQPSLVRQGEAIFYDGKRSLDQWYSCHTCHFEGGTNAVTMDTKNDGRFGNYKVVLSLRNVTHTGPWTWHGWQTSLEQAMSKSLVDSMLGPPPTDADVRALIAYLGTLTPPPNPNPVDDAVKRGEAIFRSDKTECARCHAGTYFTDGKIHTVGLESRGDVYKGFNSPSLIGVFDRPLLLHDGRAKTLREVLTKHHSPDALVGKGELTPAELDDLIAYLNTL